MKQELDLTEGNILSKLIMLSLPIMGTAFIQMAYSLIDMIWIGRLGSDEVAAVGTAGFFPWLGMAFVMISKIGGEIKVAQSIGEKNFDQARKYALASLQIIVLCAILYGFVLIFFNAPLVAFFNLGDENIINMAQTYLVIIGVGMIFNFINPVFTSIFNGSGDSQTPFIMNTIGLVFNIILDPILIFGLVGFPALGVQGAAIATVTSQIVVTISFIIAMLIKKQSYFVLNIFVEPPIKEIKLVCKIGMPVAIQSGLFTIFAMVIGRIVAEWGPISIAVQKVGSQIESISWMTASGLYTALGSFVGQNYGAQKFDRIESSVKISVIMAIVTGIVATILLVFCGEFIFSLFIANEPETLRQGVDYLKILGYSQIFMCIEITVAGVFNGVNKTKIPSYINSVLTALRIPFALILSKPLGIDGVWWAVTITTIMKGIVIYAVYIKMKANKTLYTFKEEVNDF
ncbi:MAG: MATE family efflux transporter [Epulopiscium sp. Nuni2H_MBin003]|nr:MAG: MATE family efflux transporter [Epulopiscium sp. Nuni2H_MBin003]